MSAWLTLYVICVFDNRADYLQSEMTITDVYLNNQFGSSSGKYGNVVAALSCSVGACKDIFMDNIDLKYVSGMSLLRADQLGRLSNAAQLMYTPTAMSTYKATQQTSSPLMHPPSELEVFL
jgi:hypothetical protein